MNTNEILAELAARLASVADHAHSNRQFDVVDHVGRLLSNLPLSRHTESMGRYYQALSLNRGTRGDTIRASSLFEQVADSALLKYRAKAMLALGGNSFTAGDHQTAATLYREVMRMVTRDRVFDPVTFYFAGRMNAVIRSKKGDHRGAVNDLERILPLARMASSLQPFAYYDYLNTLAVELGETGSIEQARRASEIAIASPFCTAYPEWRETFEEIEGKQRRASRSVVGVRQYITRARNVRQQLSRMQTHNVLRLPAAEPSASGGFADRHPQATQGRVVNLQEWKTAFKGPRSPLPDKLTPEQIKRMTTGEKLIRLMDLVSRDETDDEMIDRILESVEQIVLNRRGEKLE